MTDEGASASKWYAKRERIFECDHSNSSILVPSLNIDEQLMAACRNDQEDTVEEILESGNYDIKYTDGAGNTAAHLA
jgi:hypothetical protein